MSLEQILDTAEHPAPTPYPVPPSTLSLAAPQPTDGADPDIVALVNSMTLKEKIGQMTQLVTGMLIDPASGELDEARVRKWIKEWGVGSVFDSPANHGGKFINYSAKRFAEFTDKVQKIAVEEGSKKIPVVYGLDSIHGANYVDGAVMFPQPLAMTAACNPDLAYQVGRITAKDTRAAGCQWIFAPCVDMTTNKGFPRTYENFGEDPHLAGYIAGATVRGLQGDYKTDRTRVAATMKHFIGYGHPLNSKDKGSAWIPDHILLEYFVPSFQACVDAGVATAMESYNDVNGEPIVSSEFYLRKVLREIMGFKGVLVTDFQEIDHTVEWHLTAKDRYDATRQAISRTSIDISMVPMHEHFCIDLHDQVTKGQIPESRIDESVLRILQLKKDLGLFTQPYADPSLAPTVGSQQDIDVALDLARESVTLLKNEGGALPLKQSDDVLVVGPTANSLGYLSGGWTIKWQGVHDADERFRGRGTTILEGLRKVSGKEVGFVRGVDIDGKWDEGAKDAINEAVGKGKVGKVVVCLGEDSYAENFGNIEDITLAQGQLDLVRHLKSILPALTKIVLVLVVGRPRILQEIADISDAVVNTYLQGPYGGVPIAEILHGKVNPTGRQPYSYPRYPADTPLAYWYQSPQYDYAPLFPFGAGIGYAKVNYSNLRFSSTVLSASAPIKVSVDLLLDESSTFDVTKETVFLSATHVVRPGRVPEKWRVRGVKKVEVRKGRSTTVEFELGVRDVAWVGRDLRKKLDSGVEFKVVINPNRGEGETLEGKFVVEGEYDGGFGAGIKV